MNEQQVESIPISEIRIINPRTRNRLKWQLVVQSIATVGLKRPITVSRRLQSTSDGKRYDLVCGQGRMEAFVELGEMFIPAIVIEAPEQDRQLMSLVENIARRPASTHAILFEVRVLRERGHSSEQIARKLGRIREAFAGFEDEEHGGTASEVGLARRELKQALRAARDASPQEQTRIAQILRDAAAKIRTQD